MGTRTFDALNAAIQSGDKEKSLRVAKRMYREFEAMHDLLVKWLAANYNYLYGKYGDAGLYEALQAACGVWGKDLIGLYAGKSAEQIMEMLVMGIRGHLQSLRIEEDDEKYTVYCDPCGSGGRLARTGVYEKGTFAKIKKPQAMTYGQADYPVYCAHCTFQEIIPIEATGKPIFITEPPPSDQIGKAPCKLLIYKDPNKIPEKYYTKVGKKKKA